LEFKKSRRLVPQISIVSMIDVILLLLLFFMLTTTFKFTAEGMNVDLPETMAPAQITAMETVVTLNRQGEIFLAERTVSLQELRERLTDVVRERPDSLVIIKADKEVKHGWVVKVMDVINLSGVKRMAIATEPTGKS
jgi:biopolymer transport protein ExbD